MLEAGASWGVAYRDGRVLTRFDEHGENRWDAIDWPNVVRIAFASADAEAEFEFTHPGPEYDVRLGSRVGIAFESGMGIDAVRVLMLVTVLTGQPIHEDTVKQVFFWMPDGTSHDCDQYNCRDVAAYLHGLVHGTAATLAASHSSVRTQLTTVLS